MSNKELDRLGARMRDESVLAAADLQLWGRLRPYFLAALEDVHATLAALGLQPSLREKNRETLVDKLRREPAMQLSRVQDVVGARVVLDVDLPGQDGWVRRIAACFPDHRQRDRRQQPSHGYRAVHLVARMDGVPVEIQVRTLWQDRWAQAMEHLGDCWGRAIRYGGEPRSPERPVRVGPRSARARREWVRLLLVLARDVAAVEAGAAEPASGLPEVASSLPEVASIEALAALLDDLRAVPTEEPAA